MSRIKIKKILRICNIEDVLKWFLFIWIFDFLFLIISPLSPYSTYFEESFLWSIYFVFGVITSALFTYSKMRNRIKKVGPKRKKLSKLEIQKIIKVMSIISIVGCGSLLYDRVYIRGIDYSIGLRAARYVWVNSKGGGIFSIIGNLFIPMCYSCLYLSIYFWEDIAGKFRVIGFCVGIGAQMFQAILNGGRSNILIALFFSLIFCLYRKLNGKYFMPYFRMRFFAIILAAVIILTEILVVFSGSIGGMDTYSYLELTVTKGYIGYIEKWYTKDNSFVFFNMFTLIFMYMFHGQWNFAKLIGMNDVIGKGRMLCGNFISYLARLGISIEHPDNAFLNAQFLNLPGTFLYDLGWGGFFIGTIVLGILFGIALWLIQAKKDCMGGLGLCFCSAVFLVVFISPVIYGLTFGYADFALFALVVLGTFVRVNFGKRSLM